MSAAASEKAAARAWDASNTLDRTDRERNAQLVVLSSELNHEHRLANEHAAQAIGHARRAGELLIQAKAVVTHGSWESWLTEHFAGSARTARRYMRLAKRWPELGSESATVATLTGAEALIATSKKSKNVTMNSSLTNFTNEAVDAYLGVADALREARDSKLYRETHDTFDAYIQDRWGLRPELVELGLWFPTKGMFVADFDTADAVVSGVILPVAEPVGKYFSVCRFVAYTKREEGFVEGVARGVRLDGVSRWLQRLGLPSVGDAAWELSEDASWGHELIAMLEGAPRDPRYVGPR